MTDHTYTISTPPKSMLEAINVAQVAIRSFYGSDHHYGHYATMLNELARECSRKRPTGTDGKHNLRHTEECGCDLSSDDYGTNFRVCRPCDGKGLEYRITEMDGNHDVFPCSVCGGRGYVDKGE